VSLRRHRKRSDVNYRQRTDLMRPTRGRTPVRREKRDSNGGRRPQTQEPSNQWYCPTAPTPKPVSFRARPEEPDPDEWACPFVEAPARQGRTRTDGSFKPAGRRSVRPDIMTARETLQKSRQTPDLVVFAAPCPSEETGHEVPAAQMQQPGTGLLRRRYRLETPHGRSGSAASPGPGLRQYVPRRHQGRAARSRPGAPRTPPRRRMSPRPRSRRRADRRRPKST
jgi:hypothetical protein